MKKRDQKMCIENAQKKHRDAKHIFKGYSPLKLTSCLMSLDNKVFMLFTLTVNL